jgi:hypothetical protein
LYQFGIIKKGEDMMEDGYIIISAAITIVSLILLIVSIHSYRITSNSKLYFVILVFIFFLARGIFLSIGLFYEPLTSIATGYYMWIVDLIILTLLYLAAIKR